MQPLSNALAEIAELEAFLQKARAPGHFYLKNDHALVFRPLEEQTITWEIFRGQLLDSRHTREKQTFLTYRINIKPVADGLEEPLLTVRFAPSTLHPPPSTLHVTRWLHCRVWQAFDDSGVIGSREIERWVEELVGSISVAGVNDMRSVLAELRLLVFHAFVGLSRLPLNSVEAPLPTFSLGVVGFFPTLEDDDVCVSKPCALLDTALDGRKQTPLEETKLLELFLRTASPSDLRQGAARVAQRSSDPDLTGTSPGVRLRRLFNESSLTPYTDFVEKALSFARLLFEQNAFSLEDYADFLLGQIRQTVYHLTAYDLITFHHQGANYPDALLLDALLRNLLVNANANPDVFSIGPAKDAISMVQIRRRRRALALGWWMHRFLNGLPVPDEPTSPGENVRILPLPHRPIPNEQLVQIGRRKRLLYAENPIDWQSHQPLLELCWEELATPEMLLELGTGLYLDRPFGSRKPPGSLDLTPLLSYELFSRTVARIRLEHFEKFDPRFGSSGVLATALTRLEKLEAPGKPVPRSASPGMTLRLQDCWRIADDFIIRKPSAAAVRLVQAEFNWEAAPVPMKEWRTHSLMPIPMPGPTPGAPSRIIFYDSEFRPRLECEVAAEQGFRRRGALELPVPGLVTMHEGVRTVIASRLP